MYQSKEEKILKSKRGITLIALVISIIVLLILAGVSIAMLTGENGILKRTIDAKEQTEKATEEEQRQLTIAEATMNLNGTKYKSTYKGKEVTVPIPAGFAVSQVDGENTVEDGLVIIDKEGNEFVWIPVAKETFKTDFRRSIGYLNKNLQNTDNYRSYGETDGTGINDRMKVNGISESGNTKQEAIAMYKSVEENGGFFIGRYETGKNENEKIVCKRNVEVCRKIKWGNSMIDDTGGAVEMARNFDINNNYSTVNSTLCYSVQWDAALNFIDSNYITNSRDNNPVCLADSYLVDSTNKGNYSGEIAMTGSSVEYKQKNIYDMAGNVWEWTMECYGNATQRGARGGSCFRNGNECPSSCRAGKAPNEEDKAFGFRITLYLK